MAAKSLGRNAIYNIIYKVLNVVFPLISTAYVSRVLLPAGVGRLNAVNNNVSYFLILATLGIPVYGLREIAKNRENFDGRSKLFSELFFVNATLTIATYALFNVVIFSADFFKNEQSLYIIFGFTILLNIFNVDWLFQGLEEYGYIAGRSIAIKIISLLALLVFVKTKEDVLKYAIIQVIALTGNYFLNLIKLRSFVKIKFSGLNIRKHLKPLIYLALCSISTEIYAKMDITMLDIMKSSDVVGYYTNSQKIINLIVTTLVAVTNVFMPRLSYLFDKDKDKFNGILKTGFDMMVFVSIPSCFGLIVVSDSLVLSLLGKDFINASVTVSILSLMIPLKCIGDLICFQVMMCARKESLLMKSYFVTMVVNLINNLVLIPKYGAEGASIASVISEILAFVFVLWFSNRYFKLSNIKPVLFKTFACAIIMVCVVIPFNLLPCSCYLKLVLQAALGIFVYLFACYILKHEVFLQYASVIIRKIRG